MTFGIFIIFRFRVAVDIVTVEVAVAEFPEIFDIIGLVGGIRKYALVPKDTLFPTVLYELFKIV